MRPYLPPDLQNTRITAEDIIVVLGYASTSRISMEAVCHELKEALSAAQSTVSWKCPPLWSKNIPKDAINERARWFAYAVAGLPKSVEPHQVFEMYRQRFGIETSYR